MSYGNYFSEVSPLETASKRTFICHFMLFYHMSEIFQYHHDINQRLCNIFFCVVVSHKNIITLLTCDSQINRYGKMEYHHYFISR